MITAFRTLATYLFALLGLLIAGPGILLAAARDPNSPWIDRLAGCWARIWVVGAGIRLEVEGLRHIDPAGSYVVVSNHQSNLDPMCHYLSMRMPLRFLAKEELFAIPIFGSAIRSMGMVAVDRSRPSREQINRQVQQVISQRRSLIIYPEGTRSHDGEVGPFKKGPFAIAIQAGLPVVPVAIDGTFDLWRRETFFIRSGTVRVSIGSSLTTTGLSDEDVPALRDRAREVVVATLEQMRT